MKDLGAPKKILGMHVHRNRLERKSFLSQKKYIEKVLKRFDILDVKSVKTPLAAHFRLSADLSPQIDKDDKYISRVPNASTVGSIMYAMVCTRSDISHAVNVVSQYMDMPEKGHWRQ